MNICFSITTSVAIVLLAAGTGFDYYLEHSKKTKKRTKNCAHFNATLEMNMPDMKTKNGIYDITIS